MTAGQQDEEEWDRRRTDHGRLQRRQLGLGLVGMLSMILLLTTSYAMVNTSTIVDLIRNDQQTNIERTKATKANTEQIEKVAEDTNSNTEQIKIIARQIRSCATPQGECYKRGERNRGKAVANINEVVIATAACDEGSTPLPAIRACVAQLLKTAE